MKHRIVLVPFPFDDLSATKVRPAVCLTNEIKPYGHVVLAFITSQVPANPSRTDIVVRDTDPDFAKTGLKVSSTIRLHRVMTVSRKLIKRNLGVLSARHKTEAAKRLRGLFDI